MSAYRICTIGPEGRTTLRQQISGSDLKTAVAAALALVQSSPDEKMWLLDYDPNDSALSSLSGRAWHGSGTHCQLGELCGCIRGVGELPSETAETMLRLAKRYRRMALEVKVGAVLSLR
jgi:hypothetical protein